VLALVAGFGTWLMLRVLGPVPLPADYPARPDLGKASAALVELIETVDAQARACPDSAEAVGRLGMAYHANQFYESAEKAYVIASRLAPDDYRWVYYQALIKEESGDEEAQEQLLGHVLRLHPNYAPASQKLGDILLKRGRLEEAVGWYQKSLAASDNGQSPQALFGLARVAERRKDWRAVIDYLLPVSQDYPLIRPPYQLLAEAYEAVGERDKAAVVRKVLLQPNLTPVPPLRDPLYSELIQMCCSSTRLLKEAGLLSRFGRPNDAILVARRAAEVDPGDADVHHFLARTLLDFHGGEPGAVQEALSHLQEGLRLRPDDLLPLFYFATFFFDRDKTDEAVEQLRLMLMGHTDRAETYYYLGVIADRRGQNREARDHYHEALKRDPNYAEALNKLGVLCLKERKVDDAIAYFRQAVELKPAFIRARCSLGVALEQQGKLAEAIRQYNEAVRISPNDEDAQTYLAIALLKSGKVAQAVEHFQNAVQIVPEDPEAHYGLGFALALLGRREEAAREFHEALRLRPDYAEARQQLDLLGHAREE